MTSRDRISLRFDADVVAGATVVDNSPIIPSGETWKLDRLICAHGDDGTNISGGFQVDWGQTGSWETVTASYITGDTKDMVIGKDYTGDGVKKFRFIRVNLDSTNSKKMLIIAEGFKRL
jgi:hypothetical protein